MIIHVDILWTLMVYIYDRFWTYKKYDSYLIVSLLPREAFVFRIW